MKIRQWMTPSLTGLLFASLMTVASAVAQGADLKIALITPVLCPAPSPVKAN